MALSYSYATAEAAEQELAAEGFTLRPATQDFGAYWVKPSRTDGWDGGHDTVALVQVRRQRVDNGADYFDLRFF